MYLFFDFSILAFRKRTIKDNGSLIHGCTYANFDGTGKLIDASRQCLFPIDKCFWLKAESMTKNGGAVPLKIFNKHFKDKGKDNDTI